MQVGFGRSPLHPPSSRPYQGAWGQTVALGAQRPRGNVSEQCRGRGGKCRSSASRLSGLDERPARGGSAPRSAVLELGTHTRPGSPGEIRPAGCRQRNRATACAGWAGRARARAACGGSPAGSPCSPPSRAQWRRDVGGPAGAHGSQGPSRMCGWGLGGGLMSGSGPPSPPASWARRSPSALTRTASPGSSCQTWGGQLREAS